MLNFIFIITVFLVSFQLQAQSIKYVSPVDQDLTIKSVTVIPLRDNMKSIYAKPLTESLIKILESSKQWTIKEYTEKNFSPDELEENPELVKEILRKSGADSVVSGRIAKGPSGISIRLTIYAGKDGLPAGQETLSNYDGFELNDLKMQIEPLVQRLRAKLPYHASILSRKGNLVTINLGSKAGLRPNAEMTAVQIFKVDRHPKFRFIVNAENVILGKIQINKVDDYISFGTVLSEREPNIIDAGSKALVNKFIDYPEPHITADGKIITDLSGRTDENIAFGDNPSEWLPERTPSFGKVGILLGLGGYTMNNTLTPGGGVSGNSQVAPSIHVNGEMWLSPRWFTSLSLRSFAFSVNNGLSGSSPSTLNVNSNQTSLIAGYNFLIHDDFFGPKIQLSAGLSTTKTTVDASTPTAAFLSTTYSGLLMGVAGSFPVQLKSKKAPLFIGGKLDFFLNAGLSESPFTSGSSSSNQITAFSAFTEYQFSQRMGFKGELTFNLYSSNFSGTGSRPASSASQSATTLAAGIQYMF